MVATALACWLLDLLSHRGVYGHIQDSLYVTPFWQDAIATFNGQLPYRDFPLEYPPLSLVVFLLPVLLPGGGLGFYEYRTAFEVVMALCAMALVPVVVATVVRLGGRRTDILVAVGLLAVAPLLLGPLWISRYDLWPALLTAAATLAILAGRFRIAFAVLALAVLAKVYPAVLIPIFVAYAWRAAGRREAIIATATGTVMGLAGLMPFVLIDAPGALDPFARAIARPLQIETLGASVLAALHDWLGLAIPRVSYTFNSYNVEGAAASTAATLQTIALVALLVAIWFAAARGPADPWRLVVACAAAICVDVALGKVLSPQYVIWLIAPIVILVAIDGARPLAALAAILVLTQLYYPVLYQRYVQRFDPSATIAVLERNVALILLAIYLIVATAMFVWPRPANAAATRAAELPRAAEPPA